MILFIVPDSEKSENGKYNIPIVLLDETKVDIKKEFKLISWNEIKIKIMIPPKESEDTVIISNVNKLEEAVFAVAEQDIVCMDINWQFEQQYATDIFKKRKEDSDNLIKKIIRNIFQSWAHPMIGNLLMSPGIRPQTMDGQYNRNWKAFPEEYMNCQTKNEIGKMIVNPESVDLAELEKSGRDQLRVCKDMTDLARAVMGEISTYPTKKLEKIFALELCNSEILWEAQKALLKKAIGCLDADKRKNQSCKACEYLRFYFPGFFVEDGQTKKDYSWPLFVRLTTEYIGENELVCDALPKDEEVKMTNAINQFGKFPPTIRGAILINDFRKIYGRKEAPQQRFSLVAKPILKGEIYAWPFNLECILENAPITIGLEPAIAASYIPFHLVPRLQ